jgi:hypothetical protein
MWTIDEGTEIFAYEREQISHMQVWAQKSEYAIHFRLINLEVFSSIFSGGINVLL